jgi:hypothetical protein
MDFMNTIRKKLGSFEDEREYALKNRRKYQRVLLELPFEYWTLDNPHSSRGGIVIDATEVGFLIRSIENMTVGTQLTIIMFYVSGFGLGNLEVVAEIIRKNVDKKDGKYLYGLKLLGITEEKRSKLGEVLVISSHEHVER